MEDAEVDIEMDFIRGAKGDKGEKGDQGEKGEKGDTGEPGKAFTFDDLTPEQIAQLRDEMYEGMVSDDELDTRMEAVHQEIAITRQVVTVEEAIPANTEYEIPFSYTVGSNELEVKWFGWPCTKDIDFAEVGEPGAESNKVKFGWQIEPNEILEFRKRG